MDDDRRRLSLTPRTARSAVLVAAIVLAGCGGGKDVVVPTTTAPRPARRLPPNGIRIEWKREALRPAVRPGRLCIVTVKTGRFCARYETGQIPATALKIKLLEHGYIPVTVKRQGPAGS